MGTCHVDGSGSGLQLKSLPQSGLGAVGRPRLRGDVIELYHRDFGGTGEPPLVVLHGLLGSSRNWQTVGADLSTRRRVLALDLRNHGMSPHSEDHDFSSMEADLLRWMEKQRLDRVALMGHSMGGKLAMAFACHRPAMVERLVVVDIAPRDYDASKFRVILDAMRAIDPAALSSRAEAESRLSEVVNDWALIKFLATNLDRGDDGRLQWRVNIAALHSELDEIARDPLQPLDRYDGPALFVIGGRSWHVKPEDRPAILARFPMASIEAVADAGHNPHIEQRAAFSALVAGFL
jgi:pimeloyl-ACP methyl ester carboxylesterase